VAGTFVEIFEISVTEMQLFCFVPHGFSFKNFLGRVFQGNDRHFSKLML